MDTFIIEEFKHYKVFLYNRNKDDDDTDYSIQFKIPSGEVHLRFTGELYDNFVEEVHGKKIFNVFTRAEKYAAHIDLLRYEKPIFFFYNFKKNTSYITTSDEPVGEEESSDD